MSGKASVIGLGKLGSPLAACLAAKGYSVIGVDTDVKKVEALREGRAPISETGLAEMIIGARERLTATQNIEEAIAGSEITFIVVATPSEPDGGFSLRYAIPACRAIGAALRRKKDFHLVVITSTVMPGMTGGPLKQTLEEASGKRCGADFGLCYGPEFIALGSVIRDFLNPDFVLIGESDARSGEILESLYGKVCENYPAVARMNLINAEIAKLSVNAYVTTKISFANMLARMCEKLPGADVDVVTSALGMDTRIGRKYLKGAVSYGGPCFPRDNQALAALAKSVGAPADLAKATDLFNRGQVTWLAEEALEAANGEAVGILGLTYKPNTDVVEEAAGYLLAQELAKRGAQVTVYDPSGMANSRHVLEGKVTFAASAAECIEKSGAVVVTTGWREFSEIPAKVWARTGAPRRVLDCWRELKNLEGVEGVKYVRLGNGGAGVLLMQTV